LNLTKHWGKIQSGLAILSKFPITPAKNIVFPKPKKNSAAYNYFYIDRGVQICSLTLPGISQPIQLANLHLEAFDPLSRREQLAAIEQECENGNIDWAVGDWNGIERPTPSLYQSSPSIPTFPAADPKDFFDGGVFARRTGKLMETNALPPSPYSDHRAVYFDLNS
jgi:endonuclease/exonuclease/phosphatase family metal-dependent hydrolase